MADGEYSRSIQVTKITLSLVPRPICLQFNARSPPLNCRQIGLGTRLTLRIMIILVCVVVCCIHVHLIILGMT